jgi:hypothetical protein
LNKSVRSWILELKKKGYDFESWVMIKKYGLYSTSKEIVA